MEVVAAASSIIGIIDVISKASKAAAEFMRDVKDARSEMISVRQDLSSLSTVLDIIVGDFEDSSNPGVPESLHKKILGIALNCSDVVSQIDRCIRNQGGSRLSWVTSGRSEVANLRNTLQARKFALDIALEMVSM
jgi:hypothetical protein